METIIIPTSKAEHLIRKSRSLRFVLPLKNNEGSRVFPDKEIYVRLPETGKKRVIVLHSGAPDPNEGLIELELVLQILKDRQIRPEVFFSYFPYGQQDAVFLKGETNAAEGIMKKLVAAVNKNN